MKRRKRSAAGLAFVLSFMLLFGVMAEPFALQAAGEILPEVVEDESVDIQEFALSSNSVNGLALLGDEFKVVLDDYNDATTENYSRNPGTVGSISIIDSPFGGEFGKALQFSYNLSQGYNGVIHRRDIGGGLPLNGIWPGLTAIELWVQIPTPHQNPILQLNIGDAWPGTSYEVDLRVVKGFDTTSSEPQHLVIPIEQFLIKNGSTPIPSTENVISFSMYMGGSGTGDVVMDEIKLIFAKEIEIDSFESYVDDGALTAAWPANTGGGSNHLTRGTNDYGDGASTVMNFSYDAATFNSNGYTGVVKPIVGQDWSGTGAIGLWFTGDGLGQDILLQITSGEYYHQGWGVTIASSMEAHLNELEDFDPASTEPQYLLIPISAFKPKESGMALYPNDMKGFGLYVNKTSDIPTTSTLSLDHIVRYVPYGSQPIGSGEVVFDNTAMTAQGSDHLLTVLNDNATVENDGRIVAVSYESNNESILSNSHGYSYKGIFRTTGTVRLKIASVLAEINGVVQEVVVDGDIVIEVSELDNSQDVLQYLRELRDARVQNGSGLLAAMHNKEPNTNPRESTERVLNMTGETPAIWSGDFLYQARDVAARQTMINEAIRQWNDGALINVMLHVAPPNRTVEQERAGSVWDDRGATANQNGVQSYLSESQWESLLTEGEELNVNWKLRLDEYYRYLVQLKDAGVTVMFRPFHEMNQHVFWWNGNPDYTTALYRLTHDYLTDVKGLDNLIWVWNVQDLPANYGTAYGYDATNWQAFNPGEEYWDIFTIDVYDAAGFTEENYSKAVAIAGDKPMAIGECWVLPTQEEIAAQPNWVFAMPWAGDTFTKNSPEAIKAFYQQNLSIENTPVFRTLRSGTTIIEAFESYRDSTELSVAYERDVDGGSNSVALVASPFSREGRHAIAMTYTTSSTTGFTGTFRGLESTDISGAQSINMWFQGNGNSGQTVLVQLASGASGHRFQFDLLDLRGYDATSKQPQYIEIPIDDFKPLTEGTIFDASSLTGIGFYVKKLGGENRSGTLLFDDISYSTMPLAKAAPPFKVSLTNKQWTASGNDTLIKLLKDNSSIASLAGNSEGDAPYILQVLYSSSDDEILRNEGMLSSKGIFREQGEVTVEIVQVTVYADNRQYYVDVNETATIEISNLATPMNVLEYLKALTGNGILSAMHNKEPNERPRITTDRIMETTGVTPAIWSGDFLFLKEDVANRQRMIDEAIRQWNDGALINIMFHVTSPTRTVAQEKEGADWSGSSNAVQTNLTAEQWTSLLTDGGELNSNWKERLDEYALYLQQLEDAGVVPMVRPFHEMNQHVFWWAGVPENTAALYRLTKDYLVNAKGLDNMIWMWNIQDFDNRMNWHDYNPGNDYWDILTLDAYSNGLGSRADDYYTQMKQYAADAGGEAGPKPIGIGESFRLLNAAGLAKYKDYVMMMPWADDAWVYNTDEQLREFYDHTLSLLDTPVFASTRVGGGSIETREHEFDIVTEVFNWGQNVKAVVIDMGTSVNAADIGPNTFEVSVRNTTSTDTVAYEGLRSITKAYVNDTGKADGIGANSGRYVVLELLVGRDVAEAATTAWDGVARLTTLLNLDYTVKQKSAIGDKLPLGSKYMFNEQINLIVDEFTQGTYSDANGEHTYNLYVPNNKQDGEQYPLVVWLHGNGERGNVGVMPIVSSKGAVAFAEPSAQAAYGGMYVLAPQFSAAHGAEDDIVDGANELVKRLISEDGSIDPSRVYLVGGSAGGTRVWKMLLEEPNLYAAAIPICSTTMVPGNLNLTADDYGKLTHIPLWLFHAANDGTIGVANSRTAYEQLLNLGANVKYTEFANMVYNGVTYDGHHSWVPVLDNYYDAAYGTTTFDWLFAQSKDGEISKYTMTLDDFSAYTDDVQLTDIYVRNTHGGDNAITLVPSPFGDSLGNAMQFTYQYANGYSGRSRTVNGYWPGLEAVELWIQNDASHQDILLQLSDGNSYEVHLNDLISFDSASTEPQHLIIPLEEFKPKSGSDVLNTTGITTFALYVNQLDGGTGGTIIVDEIKLVFSEQPILPQISFASTSLVADKTSNLVALLNEQATLPNGAVIVQVDYQSENEAILPNFVRLVPKGDFLSEGNVDIALQQVKLYMDGATFTLDVNFDLSIAVSNLAERIDVVDYLNSVTGSGILSAMHHDQSYANPNNNDVLHQRVANEFGVYPALYSADFLSGGTVPYRQQMIDEVIRQWDNGNLVQIMFHVSPPQYTVAEEAEGGWGGDQAHETLPSPNRIFSYLYNDQWKELMTDGSPLNTNWKLRMDEYAQFLQQLEDEGVTIMLRPFHEMNQHVFWWGGRPGLEGSTGLYRMFRDYMEKEKGLSNIIWVWNIQDLPDDYGFADGDPKFDRYEGLEGGLAEYDANDWNSFNPGKDYYDILSVDFYDVGGYAIKYYEQAKAIAEADGKPMIIGETFIFPTQAELVEQPEWSMAMPWGVRTWNYNTKEEMATFYANSIGISGMPRFATRDNTVDRSLLQQAVNNAVKLSESNYSSASWTVLRNALKAAQDLLARGSIRQDEIDHALEVLQAARSGLVRIGSGGGSGSISLLEIAVGGTTIPYTRTGNRAELAISDEKLTSIISEASKSGEAIFDLSGIANLTSLSISTDVIDKLAEAGLEATFKLPSGTLSIDEHALASIEAQAEGESVVLTLEAVNVTTLTEKQLKAAQNKLVYNITVVSGGKRISAVSAGDVTIQLPYTLGEAESADGIAIWRLDEVGNLTKLSFNYDEKLDILNFNTDELAHYYVIGYDDVVAWDNPFTDVKEQDWFYRDIAFAVKHGLFLGANEVTFNPQGSMTRAMLVTVLHRLAGLPAIDAVNDVRDDHIRSDIDFSDIANGAWHADAVRWAAEQGIVTGYGNGHFGPNDSVTREQLIVILYRYAQEYSGQQKADETFIGVNRLAAFTDGKTASAWAQEALEWAVEIGLVSGRTDGTLDPQGGANRAEVAAILRRFVEFSSQL